MVPFCAGVFGGGVEPGVTPGGSGFGFVDEVFVVLVFVDESVLVVFVDEPFVVPVEVGAPVVAGVAGVVGDVGDAGRVVGAVFCARAGKLAGNRQNKSAAKPR